jgi:DNA polymerase III delta prime subunit
VAITQLSILLTQTNGVAKTFMDKHAPKGLDDLIFVDEDTKARVEQYAQSERSGNIVLKGPKGTAKSTTARIIAETVAGGEWSVPVYQAADMDEDTIDRLERDWNWGRLNGVKTPYVVIEEVDQLSPKLQRKLRATVDTYSHGKVIMTTNNDHAVDGPLLDRCDVMEMPAANTDQWLGRARDIFDKEGVSITDAHLRKLLATCNGSIRDLMRALEDYVLANK